ncbi:hypothetical protein KAR91_26180 [Candidatus Pacearchaeota archaeon]|nr:hypothetical protein [Candidatus Pacearchaeota archaeon]
MKSITEPLCNDPGLPSVAGTMEKSFREHERRLRIKLMEEQEKPLPDNSLISVLCDAVRAAREHCFYAQSNPEQIAIPEDMD